MLREPVVQEHLQAGDVGEFQSVDDLELCDVFSEGLGGQYVDHIEGLGLLQGEDTNVLTLNLTGTLNGGQFGGGVLRGSQVNG